MTDQPIEVSVVEEIVEIDLSGPGADLAFAAAARAQAAQAATEAAMASLVESVTLGRASTTGGAGGAAGTFVLSLPAVHEGGRIKRVRARSTPSGAKTIQIKVFDATGHQVGADVPMVLAGGGETVVAVDIPFDTGQLPGFYGPASGVDYIVGAPVDGGGYWRVATDNVGAVDISGAPFTNTQLQIGFDIEWSVVTPAVMTDLEDRLAAAEADVVDLAPARDAIPRQSLIETTGRPAITTTTTNQGVGGTYIFGKAVDNLGIGELLRFRNTITGGASFVMHVGVFTVSGLTATQVPGTTWEPVTVHAGTDEYPININIAPGECWGISVPNYAMAYLSLQADSGGWLQTTTLLSPGFTAASLRTDIQLQVGIDVSYLAVTAARQTTNEASIAALTAGLGQVTGSLAVKVLTAGTRPYNGVDFDPTSTQFYGWGYGADVGVDIIAGQPVDTAHIRTKPPTGAVNLRTFLYRRATSAGTIESAPGAAGDVLLGSTLATVASLGMTIGVFGTAPAPVPPFKGASGETYVAYHEWLDASGVRLSCGFGRADPTGLSQHRRGFYNSNSATLAWQLLSAAAALAWTFKGNAYTVSDLDKRVAAMETYGVGADLTLAAYPTFSTSGLVVTVGGKMRKNGLDTNLSTAITFPAATSGMERIDLIVADKTTGVVTRVAGTERTAQLDAPEYSPAAPNQKVVLASVLVSATAVVGVANRADFRSFIKVGREGEAAALIARNRALLAPIVAMATRGAAITLLGDGDSQVAMQNTGEKPAALADQYTPGGVWRDRRDYYFTSYPADTKALIPVVDFGDGKTDHIKLGENWSIKAQLDRLAGASVVTYKNIAIGSSTSAADLVSGIPNLLYPSRVTARQAVSAQIATLMIGMNDRPTPTITYANVRAWIAEQFAAGRLAVVVFGCPRPNANQSVSAWLTVNDGLEAAAMEGGAIWVPTTSIADDRNLGGIGFPAQALADTNILTGGNNHRGLVEIQRYCANALTMMGL